jgi:hypothetical protein
MLLVEGSGRKRLPQQCRMIEPACEGLRFREIKKKKKNNGGCRVSVPAALQGIANALVEFLKTQCLRCKGCGSL